MEDLKTWRTKRLGYAKQQSAYQALSRRQRRVVDHCVRAHESPDEGITIRQDRLGKRLAVCRKTVNEDLRAIVEAGVFTVERRGRKTGERGRTTNRYRLALVPERVLINVTEGYSNGYSNGYSGSTASAVHVEALSTTEHHERSDVESLIGVVEDVLDVYADYGLLDSGSPVVAGSPASHVNSNGSVSQNPTDLTSHSTTKIKNHMGGAVDAERELERARAAFRRAWNQTDRPDPPPLEHRDWTLAELNSRTAELDKERRESQRQRDEERRQTALEPEIATAEPDW